MRNLALKLAEKLERVEQSNGPFKVKCLVRREPDDFQWDLILWADWFDLNERARLSYLMDELIRPLPDEDLIYFNAMITFGPDDDSPFLHALRNIQRHYDKGAYYPTWLDGLVEIPLSLQSTSFVVPLGHRLIEAQEKPAEVLAGVAEAR